MVLQELLVATKFRDGEGWSMQVGYRCLLLAALGICVLHVVVFKLGTCHLRTVWSRCLTQPQLPGALHSAARHPLHVQSWSKLLGGQISLSSESTLPEVQGYNDGFTASSSLSITAELSPETVDPDQFREEDKQPVTEASFKVLYRIDAAPCCDGCSAMSASC